MQELIDKLNNYQKLIDGANLLKEKLIELDFDVYEPTNFPLILFRTKELMDHYVEKFSRETNKQNGLFIFPSIEVDGVKYFEIAVIGHNFINQYQDFVVELMREINMYKSDLSLV